MNELYPVVAAFLIAWLGAVIVHGLWVARLRDRDPAPPVPPDPHDHH